MTERRGRNARAGAPQPGWLARMIDGAVGALSPQTALERQRLRAQMTASQQYFEAASRSRRTEGWRAPGGDAVAAARSNGRIRLLARDFVRNNTLARRAVSVLVNNIVGDGIIPSVVCENPARKAEIERLLRQFCDTTAIDAAGVLNLYGLQRQAVQAMVEGGEALWRRRLVTLRSGAVLPFQVQALEADFLHDSAALSITGERDPREAAGVIIDAAGRRTGYRLYAEHPGSDLRWSGQSTIYPASEIIHLYRPDRPGQVRGVSWLATPMSMLADAYDLADAQLVRQKIAALFVGFVHDSAGEYGATAGPGSEEQPIAEELVPGMFETLPPGRTVTFSSPPAADGLKDQMMVVQRMIAAALDLTYEQISGDLSSVNFSSSRVGRIEMIRALSAVQFTIVIPQLCHGLTAWLREAIDLRLGGDVPYEIQWTPPRFPLANPGQEIPAMVAAIRAGLASRQQTIRELGYDPEVVARERVADMQAADAVGDVMTSDARRTSDAGVAQRDAAADRSDEDAAAEAAERDPAEREGDRNAE